MGEVSGVDEFFRQACVDCVYEKAMVFLGFCTGNPCRGISEQISGALKDVEVRLKNIGLDFACVVKIDVYLRDRWHEPVLKDILLTKFGLERPAVKIFFGEFPNDSAHDGLKVKMECTALRRDT